MRNLSISKSLLKENIKKMAKLFPSVVTESRDKDQNLKKSIDFDILRQVLSDEIVCDNEKYQLTWPGKSKAIALANKESEYKFVFDEKKSVDHLTTSNMYIQGDNIEGLKLLLENYHEGIKCIYIDPPYNTGNNFIYNDERYESEWLNMMYPRLMLARDLLKSNGAIFISIDENEVHNLRKICDEIFGKQNFVSCIAVYSNPRGRQSNKHVAATYEYLCIYAKSIDDLQINGVKLNEQQTKEFNREDLNGLYREIGLRKRGTTARRIDAPTMYFPIYYDLNTTEILLERINPEQIEILPRLENGTDGRWRWNKKRIRQNLEKLYVRKVRRGGGYEYDIFEKDYLLTTKEKKVKNLWDDKEINYDRGSQEIRELFNYKVFDYAKPVYLIKKIISMVDTKDEIILDFFSGSGTTAHAVMEMNAKDFGNRKYILVQIPENISGRSDAYKIGIKNIWELGKERIQRASVKIRKETMAFIDYGFSAYLISKK